MWNPWFEMNQSLKQFEVKKIDLTKPPSCFGTIDFQELEPECRTCHCQMLCSREQDKEE